MSSCDTRRRIGGAVLLGTLAWGLVPWLPIGTPPAAGSLEHGFLFLPLVAAPVALVLAWRLQAGAGPIAALPLRITTLQPLASLAVLISFLLPRGPVAATLVIPWLALALSFAGASSGRADRRDASVIAARVFLPIGAVWLLMSRFGVVPGGLTELGVLLATVHFHFTGFALQILVAATGRRLPARLSRPHRAVAVLGVVGLPMIAVGKSLDVAALRVVGVTAIVVTMLAVALLSYVIARTTHVVVARRLLGVAAAACVSGSVLAAVYEICVIAGAPGISVAAMAMTHGLANALFVACASIAHLRLASEHHG